MNKITTPLAVCLMAVLFSSSINAQTWGFGQIGHWAQDVSIASDGNIWIVGYGGDDPLWGDVTSNYVAKLNSDGEKQWGHTPTGLIWAYASALNVMPVEDGGAIIYCSTDTWSPGLYKVDADGNVVWETSGFVGEGYFYGGLGVQLTDGRIIMGGLTDFEHTFYEFDAAGNNLSTFNVAPDTAGAWGWTYWDYKETGMIATEDGGFAYATGNESQKLLYKFDSGLNIEWVGAYDHVIEWEYGMQNALKGTSDGGFLFSGSGSDIDGLYYGTVRKIASDGAMEWVQTYNHGSEIEEGAWALELGPDNYVIWTQDEGDASTAGWVTDLSGVETGSIEIPILNCLWGYSETGMEVWDVESTPDGGYLIAGRQFLEDCDQRLTVIKSNPDGSFDPCIFNCVWPGDANNDGYADATDLFEIGINYGATGTSRDDMTIDWSAKLSAAWMEEDSVFWYILNDLKWTDCDGNGTINDDDTTAVINNLGLDHPLNNLRVEAGDAPLYLAPVDEILHVGVNEIPIMLGDDITSIEEIYGIAFTINVESEVIDAASIKVSFDDGWMGNIGETLRLSKNFGDEQLAVNSIVRKDRINTSGNGQIGTLSIVVVDNITGKTDAEETTFSFSDITAIKLNREIVPVISESLTMEAEVNSALNENAVSEITLYPNPANDVVYLDNNSGNIMESITISDVTGRILLTINNPLNNSTTIDVSSLTPGNYFIEINTGENIESQNLTIF